MSSLQLLRKMMLIRAAETRLAARPDHGFQLFSTGEEAVSVGVCAPLQDGDQLLSGGRSIGAALARGVDPAAVLAELLGKSTGTNQGRAGRGHMAQPASGFFGAHAVVGGNLTIAAGVALAARQSGADTVVMCIFGDGACGSGALHEAMNIAALWQLPLVFVCNNNGFSVATPPSRAIAASALSELAAPFGMPRSTIDGMDVEEVVRAATACVAHARSGQGPAFLECRSERFSSHSTATRDTRSRAELDVIHARCPIEGLAGSLLAAGLLSAEERAAMEQDVMAEIDAALALADAAPLPDPAKALSDV